MLEEDGDSGYGGGNSKRENIVKEWKKTYGLKHYFNIPGSPDLSLIENCWRAVKQYIRANLRLGVNIMELAVKGWRRLTKEKINRYVDSMIRRMQDMLKGEGLMTRW